MSILKDKPLKKCHTDNRKMIDDIHEDMIKDMNDAELNEYYLDNGLLLDKYYKDDIVINDTNNGILSYFGNKKCLDNNENNRKEIINKYMSNIDDSIQKFLKIWNSYGGKYCKYIDLERHDMLELDAYVHITSPIRRLVDLLTMMKLQESLKLVEWGEEATQFYNYWTSDSSIEYINTTMRSIRRVQNDCLLLNICSTNKKIFEPIFQGFIFDKIKRNDGLYQYMVYLKELNMTNRITTRQDLNNYTYQDFKIYIFHDQERLKHKVRLEFQHK